ncbi:unnamed protein product, partial [Mesorhabditis belari]|uniref:Uncharacterized protein n=1 Tax=Mesorhabditis belari TaxID=2138241 RepID=A0AAF3ELZ2_9BILA
MVDLAQPSDPTITEDEKLQQTKWFLTSISPNTEKWFDFEMGLGVLVTSYQLPMIKVDQLARDWICEAVVKGAVAASVIGVNVAYAPSPCYVNGYRCTCANNQILGCYG